MQEKSYNREHLDALDGRFRANLINSLSGYKSLNLVGTIDNNGQSNLSIFSSMVHIGANPPLQALISRPNTVERHTLNNIKENKYFTLNQVHEGMYEKAHQCSAKYTKNESEFDEVGLNEWKLEGYDVPFVKEAFIKTLMKLKEIIPLQVNGTLMIIGEVIWCSFPEHIQMEDGYLDLAKVKTVVGGSMDGYYKVQGLSRLSYAEPNQPLEKKNL